MATSVAAIRTLNTKNSPLLSKLPGELRKQIYRLSLLESFDAVDFNKIRNKTALLRTCAQLKEEAAAVFFRETQFIITDATAQHRDLKKLLESMGNEDRRNVSAIVLDLRGAQCGSKEFSLVESHFTAGMTMQESVDKAMKELGWPEGTQFEDVIMSIFDKLAVPASDMATLLIENEVPILSIRGRLSNSKALLNACKNPSSVTTVDSLLELSQACIGNALVHKFVETAVKVHNQMPGTVGLKVVSVNGVERVDKVK